MTINIDTAGIDRTLWVLLAAFGVYAILKFALEQWQMRERERFNDRQRARDLDVRADERNREQDAAARRLATSPLPGPALAGECARRMSYADALDRNRRPGEANVQRGIAGSLGALSHLALLAGDQDDRADWSRELRTALLLVGAPLLPAPGWEDPRPADTDGPQHAEEFSPRWVEAVRALREAVLANMQPDDFGPGMSGRGILTSAGAYGYAAAPELPTTTVEAFLRDWCHALYGEEPERTWPVDLPAADSQRVDWYNRGDQLQDEYAALRRHVDAVLHVTDFRGLMGRGKSAIVDNIEADFGFGTLPRRTVDEFVGDYALAITGQRIEHPDRWADHMPETDPSRVLPLDDDLQPAELRD